MFAPTPISTFTTPAFELMMLAAPPGSVRATVSPLGTFSAIVSLVPGCVVTAPLQFAVARLAPATAVTVCDPIVKLYWLPTSVGLDVHLQTLTVDGAPELVNETCVSWP